jgi:hypothetical protein
MGILALACYIMARCFDVPAVPSILAAQSTVLLFAPTLLLLHMPTVYCLTPGNAVVYAPHLVALGLLARVQPASWRKVVLITAAIATLLFYSLYCDPLWTTIGGISWALPFAVVALGVLHLRTILMRCAVLASCVVLLAVSGAVEYLYTLSQYTARVQFSLVVDRPRGPGFVSALTYSPNMKTFYLACIIGWLLGLAVLRGRPRVLVIAGALTFIAWIAYSLVYLLILNKSWVPPIPMYIEHSLFPLYLASAISGYWGASSVALVWGCRLATSANTVARSSAQQVRRSTLGAAHHLRRCAFTSIQRLRVAMIGRGVPRLARLMAPLARLLGPSQANEPPANQSVSLPTPSRSAISRGRSASWARCVATALPLVLVALIPGVMANFALNRAGPVRETFYERWPNEPEVDKLLAKLRQAVGEPFRGSVLFWYPDYAANLTLNSAWAVGVPTVNEYSQLVTPQSLYFIHKLFQKNVRAHLNVFLPSFINGVYAKSYWGVLQMFGVRYVLGFTPLMEAQDIGTAPIALPHMVVEKEPPVWLIYELPHPNLGDYSPTQIFTAGTADETTALLASPGFDFSQQAVLEAGILQPLTPARGMSMVRIRGGIHVSGTSDGTSLVIFPLQFTHCLWARDKRVRLVRANLMMTGVIFSGELDTDILFDYGVFSPRCRRADIVDMKRLGVEIDLRMPHLTGERLFPDWDGVVARMRAAVAAIQ